jgi:endonuclease/exonuclease/phosphatase family metal-dependent hydrolase
VLSRLPLGTLQTFATVVTPIEGTTDDAGRPAATSLINHRLWTTTVQARPDYAFTLVGAHLKAGGGERNAGWRRGQVRLLHDALARERQVCPAANVLIAGDLNMLADSPERTLLLNQDGALGPVQFVDPLEGSDALTHPAEAPERQLDYLLPSETMQPEMVPGSVRVAQPLDRAAQARASDHLPVVGRFVAAE